MSLQLISGVFDHSLYTNPDPWVTPELCPHSRVGWGAGSPMGPLAVTTVSPGIGPVELFLPRVINHPSEPVAMKVSPTVIFLVVF